MLSESCAGDKLGVIFDTQTIPFKVQQMTCGNHTYGALQAFAVAFRTVNEKQGTISKHTKPVYECKCKCMS